MLFIFCCHDRIFHTSNSLNICCLSAYDVILPLSGTDIIPVRWPCHDAQRQPGGYITPEHHHSRSSAGEFFMKNTDNGSVSSLSGKENRCLGIHTYLHCQGGGTGVIGVTGFSLSHVWD